MALDDGVSALIADIYAGATDPVAWRRALDGLIERTNSRFVLVSTVDHQRAEYVSTQWHGADDARFQDAMRDYQTELYRSDPTLQYAMRNPAAGFVSLRSVIEATGGDHHNHPYAHWLRDQIGVHDSVVRYTPPVQDFMLGVSLHPASGRTSYDPEELKLFFLLFDHMENALRLAAPAPDFSAIAEAAIVVDGVGRIVCINERAEALLAASDGIRIADRRICAATRADSTRLDRAIASAANTRDKGSAGGSVLLTRSSGKRALAVTVVPLADPRGPFAAFGSTALVRIVDPEAGPSPESTARWAALYGLTPAEVRLASALMQDEGNLRSTAERLGVSYATARVQLASIFDKVGVNSQAQLARLLSRI
jgi:DNA-binding CsgD family transcriptional regulator